MANFKKYTLQDIDSIRLLTLHPRGSGVMVKTSMHTVRLSAKPKFNALSYTWGNPTDEQHPSYQEYDRVAHHILCGEEIIAVQQNLYEALCQMREKQEYTPIWVDAICIDQENKEELNHQLSLMTKIYNDATWVVVWLGKEDRTTQEAMHSLNGLERGEGLLAHSTHPSETTAEFFHSFSQESRRAIMILLRRTWFNRVWTLQEAILPARIRGLCGPHEFDIGAACLFASLSLRIASSYQGAYKTSPDSDELPLSQLSGAACIAAWYGLTLPAGGLGSRAFFRYPKVEWKSEVSRTFKWLMALETYTHEARQRNCSLPADKILAPLTFALHEMFTPKEPEFLSVEAEARRILDCRLPVAELYLMFTRFMIDSMATLDILSRARPNPSHEASTTNISLPSWVPPYHEVGTTSLLDELLLTRYDAADYLGPYRPAKRNLYNPLELPVRAVFFARVIQISKYTAPADNLYTWFSRLRDSDRYKNDDLSSNCSDFAHTFLHKFKGVLDVCTSHDAKFLEHKQKFMRGILSSAALMQLNTSVSPTSMRKLFRYDVCGQLQIGLAPVQAQESDHICIIQGARVPFILRSMPEHGKYMLVGEALAENFMYGQVKSLGCTDREIFLV